MTKCLLAHTAAGSDYPAFINVSEQGKTICITVRARAKVHKEHGYLIPGEIADIFITPSEFRAMLNEIDHNFKTVENDPNQLALPVSDK